MQRERYGKDLKEGDSYPESAMTERCYSRGLDLGNLTAHETWTREQVENARDLQTKDWGL